MIDPTAMTYGLVALSTVSVVQLVALLVLLRRRHEASLSSLEPRLSRYGEALTLLTDTTQAGFASVAAELERTARRRPTTAGRKAASKRILSAARDGRSIQDIAIDEDLSESEIRLHLGLAKSEV